jgi:DNA-binding response OmpR family regulator
MQEMAEVTRTLVVDDDRDVRFFLQELLLGKGHAVTAAADGEKALERLRETPFDLAILDLNLGGRIDGLRVLQAVKWRWPNTATIILTGHGSLDSAIQAIREGIDAYILKPVAAAEIRRTVDEVLSRRTEAPGHHLAAGGIQQHLQVGPFDVDLPRRRITRDGDPLELTACEYDLMVYFMNNTHRVVSPEELVEVVRDYKCDDVREARDIIKWYIHALRRKVEPQPSLPRYILNVRGVGYTLKE